MGRIARHGPRLADGRPARASIPRSSIPQTDEDADAAKAVCAECPVQTTCLEHAIGHREHNGVWGGATERERQRIIRRRAGRAAMANTGSR